MVTSQWLGFNRADGGLADEIREWAMLVYKHPEKLDMREVILEALEVIEFGWELGQVGMFEVRAAHTFSGRPEIFRAEIPAHADKCECDACVRCAECGASSCGCGGAL